VWSPNGKQLAYAYGTRLYLKDVGGAADAKLIKDVGKPAFVSDWTRDGFLVYTTGTTVSDIFSIPVQGGDPASAGTPEGTSYTGTVSPDGRLLAYGSSRSGRSEVYVRPFTAPGSGTPPPGPVIQVSANGGGIPKWRADGKELFFLGIGGSIMSAAIEASNGVLRPATAVPLKITVPAQGSWSPNRTGQRFLLASPLDQDAKTPITVVTNWEAVLKRQ
jgi:Tol biopolymer transport system component